MIQVASNMLCKVFHTKYKHAQALRSIKCKPMMDASFLYDVIISKSSIMDLNWQILQLEQIGMDMLFLQTCEVHLHFLIYHFSTDRDFD